MLNSYLVFGGDKLTDLNTGEEMIVTGVTTHFDDSDYDKIDYDYIKTDRLIKDGYFMYRKDYEAEVDNGTLVRE